MKQTILDTKCWIVPFNEVKFLEKLGSGSYGEVFKATVKSRPRAVKKLKISEVSDQMQYKLKLNFFKEVLRLCNVNSDKAIMLQGISIDQHPCIITDLIQGTDMYKLIYQQKVQLTPN